ncbi:MAG: diacylglycerol/polyprenol kinase family protein [Candidatus Helarchaeota archaeon]
MAKEQGKKIEKGKAYILSSMLIIGAFITVNLIGFFFGILNVFVLIILFTLFFVTTLIIELYSGYLTDVSIEKWGATFRKYSHLSGGIIMLFFVITSAVQLSWICLSILVAFLLHEFFYVKKQIFSIYTLSLIFIGRLDRKNASNSSPTPKPFYPTMWLLGSIAIMGLFGRDVTLAAIINFAFGDFLSTIIGERFGRHKLPYNKSKSLEGSLAFFGITFIGVFLAFYWSSFNYLLIAFISASVGTLIESAIPTNYWLDDNFAVPIGVGFVLYFSNLF